VSTTRPIVAREDIRQAVSRLGLFGHPVCVHSSLRSFGRVEGGPEAMIGGLLDEGCTVLVATMANQFSIRPPPDDRPARNGLIYEETDRQVAGSPWPGMAQIYDPSRTETDEWLGATPAYVAALPGRVRCVRPVGDFSAVGPLAAALIAAEVAEDVFGPLRELVAREGSVVLMGVSLTSMTLLHLAEVEAGRRPFIRWALGPDGNPVRSRGGECSRGFDKLADALAPVERRAEVGASLWRIFPARDTLRLAAEAIRSNPEITRCARADCLECPDAIAGGPIEG
jgi:aminoglycoside 3-N-acetyltransferase